MKLATCVRIEISRLLQAKSTWLVILTTIACELLGYKYFQPATDMTLSSRYIANPVLTASAIGPFLFALLSLFELNRIHKNDLNVLTDTKISPITMGIGKYTVLLLTATLTGVFAMLLYFPFTLYQLGNLFRPSLYLFSYLMILIPSLWIGCTLATIFYQITRRVDLSFVLFLVLYILPFNPSFVDNFILRWQNPNIVIFSDAYSNDVVLHSIFYNRLVWLTGLLGLYGLSCLFIRRYGKGAVASFLYHCKAFFVPLLCFGLLAFSTFLYQKQPFINHAPKEFQMHEDMNTSVVLQSVHTEARPNILIGRQEGVSTFLLTNESMTESDCWLTIDCGYKIKSMTANGKPLAFEDLNNDKYTSKQIQFKLPGEKEIELVVEYGGYPQIWSQSASMLYGSDLSKDSINLIGTSFAPLISVNSYREAKNTATVVLPENMEALVMRGETKELSNNGDGTKTWEINVDSGSGMIYLYAADYTKVAVDALENRVDFYYNRKNKPTMEKYKITETLQEVLSFYTETYGPLRMLNDNKLVLLELSARIFGGYAVPGMSVFGETTFAEQSLKDPWKGASGQEVMAHEIAHQWWGGLGVPFAGEYEMTNKHPEWSSEGFTVFTTYRMMKKKYGDEYAKRNYVDVWTKTVDKIKRNFYYRNPQYLEILPEKYVANIRVSQEQAERYCLMPLKLLKAAELLGGEEKLDEVMANIYIDKSAAYSELSYEEFLQACGLTEEDLNLD